MAVDRRIALGGTCSVDGELAVGFADVDCGLSVEVGTSSRTGPGVDSDGVPDGRAVVG